MSGESEKYHAILNFGVFRALAAAGVVNDADGTKGIVVLRNEAIDVLTGAIAVLVAKSDSCSSPTKTRALYDSVARDLRQKITQARQSDRDFIDHIKTGAVH